MALSERLYELRKKRGLSQEQLADQLGVSRQAVSKWESGRAVPETNTLISISTFFDVSLDYLMKEDDSAPHESPAGLMNDMLGKNTGRKKSVLGMICCIGGIICMIIWAFVSILIPSMSHQISESSVITVDGNGILLILCLAAVIAGAVFLLSDRSEK